MKRGILLVFLLLVSVTLICALGFTDVSEGDFLGNYNNTFYNSSGFIQVNSSSTNTVELFGNESGMIAYWRFNESSWGGTSNEVKEVIGSNHGVSVNGANTTTGLFDRAGSYDGVNDRVRVVDASELNPEDGNYTITGWAYSKPRAGGAANQWQLYVAKRTSNALDGYYVGLNQGSGVSLMVGDGTNRYDTRDGTGYVAVNYNEWFHFAAVIDRNNNQIRLYVNGVSGANQTLGTLGNISNNANLTFGLDEGQIATQGGYPVNGSIDEVAFWNRILNLSEIQELYENGNTSALSTGTYESEAKDAGTTVNWTNISWNGGLSVIENGKANSLLMHLDGNADDENGVNDGTVNGATNVSGRIIYAYDFDGTDDYINISDDSSLDFASSFSLGAWVNISSLPGVSEWDGIITKGGDAGDGGGEDHNYFLAVDQIAGWGPGVGIVFGYENSAGTNYQARYQIDSSYIGQWLHLVGVYNDSGDTITLYINGTQVAQESATGTPNTQNLQTLIGRNIDGTASLYYFDGIIDEVFIGDSALTLGEIQEIYDENDYDSTSGGSSDLKFQVQTSDDNSSWSAWLGPNGEGSYYTSPDELNLSDSRYIKYKAFFENTGAELYNVTVNYSSLVDLSISLDSPLNATIIDNETFNVSCSVVSQSELANITLYHDKFTWAEVETKNVSGTSNSSTFTLVEMQDDFIWNCYVCNSNNCSFAESNYSVFIDHAAPNLTLVSPENDTENTTSNIIDFTFNAVDDKVSSLNCSLYINGTINSGNSSVISGVNTTITSSALSQGNYTWYVNCSDGFNYNVSEIRIISVTGLALWAKANTHMHTTESDGDSSVTDVVSKYKDNLSYNILFITDHNPYGGYNNYTPCDQYNNLSENFICIHSEEFTVNVGHTTLNNINSAWSDSTSSLSNIQNSINNAVDNEGFAVLAHPSWTSGVWWSDSEINTLDNYTGIEIYNKKIEVLNPGEEYAVDRWDDFLVNGSRMFAFAVDDMHILASEAGYGWTKVYVDELTNENVVDRYKEGYFYASTGLSMDEEAFELTCDGSATYHMGEEANCSAINVSAVISASSGNNVTNISLIKDGEIIYVENCTSENCSFNFSEDVPSSGYYRLEALDSDDKWIWSNPIWVTKIATPTVITVNAPANNSDITDYTPLLNVSLNQDTYLWYNIDGGDNTTLCDNCSSYSNYLWLNEGSSTLNIYSNNSDNIIYSKVILVDLDFNKTISESFEDNSSINDSNNLNWSSGKITCPDGVDSCNFTSKKIIPSNNLTSLNVTWEENNTGIEVWLHGVTPIRFFYMLDNDVEWQELDNNQKIEGFNGGNLTYKFQFYKNSNYSINLLSVDLYWTEFEVPLISSVSESTGTTSATISWSTDVSSNSSVEYGTSFSLGGIESDASEATSHSISLSGLSSNTLYYYKIISCTVDSCSEYPQYPYPLDSFTTQSSGGGGSGGGGGSSSTTPAVTNVTTNITETYVMTSSKINDVIAKAGDLKNIVWTVKNTGTLFLNDCTLEARGDTSSWLTVGEIKDLAAGQEHDFIFKINVPKETSAGKYNLGIELVCKELIKSDYFNVEIIEEEIGFELIKIERKDNNKIAIYYLLKELSGIDQEIELQFLLYDENNNKILEAIDVRELKANEEGEFGLQIQVDRNLEGNLNLLVNLNSEIYSGYVQEDVFLAPISGFSIFGKLRGTKESIVGFILIGLLGGFIIFMIARIIKRKKLERHRQERRRIFISRLKPRKHGILH